MKERLMFFNSKSSTENSLSKQNHSTIVAEKIHEVLNVYFKVPIKTRWNSMYDALLQLKRIINGPDGEK